MGLFREEVLSGNVERLHGTISLAVPVGWQVVAGTLALIVGSIGIFLASANYSRTESASGSVVPSSGILQVVSSSAGRVERVFVGEGQLVRQGQGLVRIKAGQTDGVGADTQTDMLLAIEQQQRGLDEQLESSRAASSSEQAGFEAEIEGLRQEVQNIDAQLAVQRTLVGMAEDDLAQAKKVASRGFVSRRDLMMREEALLSRQQQLATLRQTRAAKVSGINQTIRARLQAAEKAYGSAASLMVAKAQIQRERAAVRGAQGYLIVAPVGGRVAALDVHVGDALKAQDTVMAIVPSTGRLVARLLITDKAAGFVTVGQSVRLALDAYPYERFGTVSGIITLLSTAPLMRPDNEGKTVPFYVATVSINKPWINAYGQRRSLRPGMTLTARIVVEHRSLLQWLFDPLRAAAFE